MSEDYKNQVEALLFASGKAMDIEFMADVMGVSKELVKSSLAELKKDYDENNQTLMIIEEGNNWKITVREKYLPLVRKIVADTELSKTVMETLAVIAWKSPVLQSEVITIRTNKAYDHIGELLDAGFVTKEKHGRSFMLKVTNKFYEYFDVEGADGIREVFAKIKEQPAQKKVDEFKEGEDKKTPEKVGDLEVVDTEPDKSVEEAEEEMETEKVGDLEVYEETKEQIQEDNELEEKEGNEKINEEAREMSEEEAEKKTEKIVKEMLSEDEKHESNSEPDISKKESDEDGDSSPEEKSQNQSEEQEEEK